MQSVTSSSLLLIKECLITSIALSFHGSIDFGDCSTACQLPKKDTPFPCHSQLSGSWN